MRTDLDHLVEEYLAGPSLLRHAVAGLSAEQVRARPVPGKWSNVGSGLPPVRLRDGLRGPDETRHRRARAAPAQRRPGSLRGEPGLRVPRSRRGVDADRNDAAADGPDSASGSSRGVRTDRYSFQRWSHFAGDTPSPDHRSHSPSRPLYRPEAESVGRLRMGSWVLGLRSSQLVRLLQDLRPKSQDLFRRKEQPSRRHAIPCGVGLLYPEVFLVAASRAARSYTPKEVPQPQVRTAKGLLKTKPRLLSPS